MRPSPIRAMYSELDSLASEAIDGQLGEKGAARLRQLFGELPDGRQRFAEHFFLDAALSDEIEVGSILWKLSSHPGGGQGWKRWTALAAAVVVSAIAVGLVWERRNPDRGDGSTVPVAGVNDSERFGVAILHEVIDVEWAYPEQVPRTDAPLVPQGVLHLAFYSGASVILQGPGKFDLVSPELGVIHYGKLRAHVPPAAKGFTIKTDTFEILDLGTEFAIDLSRDGSSQVHVIDGEVIFMKNSEPSEPQHLLDGEGIGLDSVGEISRFASRPEEFVGVDKFEEMSRARSAERAQACRTMADRLCSDPTVIAYYSFARNESWGTSLKNKVWGADRGTDGTVVGCRWGSGRWTGDGALHFSKSSDRVRVNLPGTFQSLSLAVWLKIENIETKTISITSPATDQPRYIHWVLQRHPNGEKLQAGFLDTTKVGGKEQRRHHLCKTPIVIEDVIGRWIHLVATYDSGRGEVVHFLNGEVIGRIPVPEPRPVGIGSADLGNWPYQEWAAGTQWAHRQLDGALGEFVALSRVLSPGEVAEIFRAGRP